MDEIKQIVIDTNVWVNALSENGNKEYRSDALLLLTNVMQIADLFIDIDNEGDILKEYRDNVGNEPLFQLFIQQLFRENRFNYVSADIPKHDRDMLISLGFHEPEDHVFVGTALKSGKYIVTDDSDYGTHGEEDKREVNDYMKSLLRLRLENSKEGLKTSLDLLRIR
nr:PIN domain-containing protein [uncultured Butyrivibrio sp.]